MKLETITLYHVQMPLVTPFATSFGSIDTRECILLEVRAAGLVGWGECVADRDPGYAYETVGTAWHILRDFLVPPLLGKEILDVADFNRQMAHVKGHPMAKAGIGMAFWDLYGKMNGSSVRELLGGRRTRVDVGVSIGIQNSPAKLVAVVNEYLRKGTNGSKLKSNLDGMLTIQGQYEMLSLCYVYKWTQILLTRWKLRRSYYHWMIWICC